MVVSFVGPVVAGILGQRVPPVNAETKEKGERGRAGKGVLESASTAVVAARPLRL